MRPGVLIYNYFPIIVPISVLKISFFPVFTFIVKQLFRRKSMPQFPLNPPLLSEPPTHYPTLLFFHLPPTVQDFVICAQFGFKIIPKRSKGIMLNFMLQKNFIQKNSSVNDACQNVLPLASIETFLAR